jgi:class 3 adenylate cyclase
LRDAAMTVERLPAGVVTFVFTDIEGSTQLVQRLGDRYADMLDTHNEIITFAFASFGGVVFGSQGDALFAAFADPPAAVGGAFEAQRALRSHQWDGFEVRVRMGIHTGEAVLRGGTYIGLDVHRVARICGAACGGQVLLSASTVAGSASDLPEEGRLVDIGPRWLKDLPGPDRLFELTHPGLS